MTSISFIFPSSGECPSGGLKVICEYANRLAADGFTVHIVYAGSLFWRKKSLRFKLSGIARYIQRFCSGYSCQKWFALNKKIGEHLALSLNYPHIPQSDIYIATSPLTAMYLKDYHIDASRKYYFIQDYENWGGMTDSVLRSTYHYPVQIIVVSNWLKNVMEKEKVPCRVIPNGFDFDYFKMNIPIKQKDKYRVTMLNHFMERKGCKYGFEALACVKEQFPALRVNLFGTGARPMELPDWYDYYRSPNQETLNRIYNEASIFLGTSNIEGFGLPIGEAMICGQAVVCTDNQGYREMAVDGQTALLSPIKNSQGLADNMIRLIKEDKLRYEIAERGHEYIQQFKWEKSYALLRDALHI